MLGAFLFGLFTTSVLTDILKLITGRQRPYFLQICLADHVCQNYTLKDAHWVDPEDFQCGHIANATLGNSLRVARSSFPSSGASLVTFVGFFLIGYFILAFQAKSGRMITSWFSMGILLIILATCAEKVATFENHITDVQFGFGLGLVLAVYSMSYIARSFQVGLKVNLHVFLLR